MNQADTIRASFRQQAKACTRMGSPFTGMVVALLADSLDRSTRTGRRVLDWDGVPDATGDALALRLAGAFRALVNRGRLPVLAALYPPAEQPEAAPLSAALRQALAEADDELATFLDYAPQTNEVARSGVLYPGLVTIARETGLPLSLFELGASAGLNLIPDRYRYTLGSQAFGDRTSEVHICPAWSGAEPEGPDPVITSRRGCDLNPLDLTDVEQRARMIAYIWPDQAVRLARIEAAIDRAIADPPAIDRLDAADWVEARIGADADPGTTRVLFHSIAFQYMPNATKTRIDAVMEKAGDAASADRPLAWLSFELDPAMRPELTLTLWPGGVTRKLADADPHVRSVNWIG